MAKDQLLRLRVSEEEKKAWFQKAQIVGLSLSELIRQSLESATIIQTKKSLKVSNTDLKKLLQQARTSNKLNQLARLDNNLNLLARWVNHNKEAIDAMRVIIILMEIKEEVKRLTDAH